MYDEQHKSISWKSLQSKKVSGAGSSYNTGFGEIVNT